jgi:hypothetical protein
MQGVEAQFFSDSFVISIIFKKSFLNYFKNIFHFSKLKKSTTCNIFQIKRISEAIFLFLPSTFNTTSDI